MLFLYVNLEIELLDIKVKRIALISGITGQNGSFLAEFLMEKEYDVHGTIRCSSVDYRIHIAHLEGRPNFHLYYADLIVLPILI